MRHGVNDSFGENEKKEKISNFVICLNFVFLIKYCVRFLISPEKNDFIFKKIYFTEFVPNQFN